MPCKLLVDFLLEQARRLFRVPSEAKGARLSDESPFAGKGYGLLTAMPDPWGRVLEQWYRLNVAPSGGVTEGSISAFESRFHVVLPADVRCYFELLNGTGDDMDDELYRFWPLNEVKPVHEVLSGGNVVCPDRFAYPDCYVFADHCMSCWHYAVKLTADPKQPAPVFRVTAAEVPGEQMTSSFQEFMSCYADDANSII